MSTSLRIPPLQPACSARGASMGRHENRHPGNMVDFDGIVLVTRVPLFDGNCYDRGGAYWGQPDNLYRIYAEDIELDYFERFTNQTWSAIRQSLQNDMPHARITPALLESADVAAVAEEYLELIIEEQLEEHDARPMELSDAARQMLETRAEMYLCKMTLAGMMDGFVDVCEVGKDLIYGLCGVAHEPIVAETWHQMEAYVGDDGKVYFSGGNRREAA